ncbi:phytoene synthase [Parasphingopyxis lamellibrachiae]|uniref:Phytoene synthase n=2 Tax=Parasphingopyxis lamellibrachiae TaxID=680125 RepID=A0A3D9FDA9_9SPHN|nr:phytoene synthase [Parasphingopyxis lamellibrachiae]
MKVNGMFAMLARLGRTFPMTEPLSDPERELALSYAAAPIRPHLRTLWRLDERFGAIVAGTTETTIGEMRLLWWREAIAISDEGAKAEPLLEQVAGAIEATRSDAAEWGAMAEGWHALLQEPLEAQELDRFANERGGRLFTLSAEILSGSAEPFVTAAGRGWALADLSSRISDADARSEARAMARKMFDDAGKTRWPRSLRPLGALAMLARRDAVSRRPRRQGSPVRVARMAWHGLTGR